MVTIILNLEINTKNAIVQLKKCFHFIASFLHHVLTFFRVLQGNRIRSITKKAFSGLDALEHL